MEKLLELLNEYNKNHHNKSDLYYLFEIENWMLFCYDDVTDVQRTMQDEAMVICSKRFLFIKRLVENDKIDRHSEKLELDMKRMRIPQDYYISWCQSLDLQHKKAQYLSLIALLAIQDNPIQFLIDILA